MKRFLVVSKYLSLILIALMLWHYEGVWLYVRAQTQAARAVAFPKEIQGNSFDSLLAELKEVVKEGGAKTKATPERGFADINRLTRLKEKLVAENARIQEHFEQLERFLKQKGLSAEILDRHQKFVSEYDAKYQTLMIRLEEIESAHSQATGILGRLTGKNKNVDWDGVIGATLNFLDTNTPKPAERHFDPNNLPHRSLRADKPIPPKLTREEWLNAFPASSPSKVDFTSSTKSKNSVTPFATAPPTPADLAETIEVKFTPDIRQLADSLQKNPVKIFNWVRNNIEFVPTWGSIQGAQLCLETRACNAFDTSSLLISLFRYSGVPSRYQMGTIEVPVERFKNWAGGFTNAEAAASLFASGGVPSVVRRVNQGGQPVTVRLEHVWVKAFVDYAPSAGAINLHGDTWIELDASFKQYTIAPGVDFETAVPSHSQALADRLVSTATVDPNTGSVTNINSSEIPSFSQGLAVQRSSYAQASFPNASGRDLFGGTVILEQHSNSLPGTLPYRTLVRASEESQIPDGLRHKVTFTLASNALTPNVADLWSFNASLAELAGKSLTLLYSPASSADEQLVRESQDAPSLPALVNVVPQLYCGNQQVALGRPLRLGSPVVLQMSFASPTNSTPLISNTFFAGEAAGIALDLQGVSPVQLQASGQRTENLANLLQQQTPPGISNRDLAEAFLSTVALGWFATVDINNRLTSQQAGVVTIRYPSAGLFFLKLNPTLLFGATSSVSMHGLNMDIDRDFVVSVAKDNNTTKTARLNFAQGTFGSAMEAELPARLYSTPDHPVSGVGTAQALKAANDQGIPVYHIDSANAAAIIPLLHIAADDLTEVQDALNAGMEVIIPARAVSFNGGSLLGIVIKDPQTGSANFLISGGSNGAIIFFFLAIMLGILTIGFFAGALLLAIVAAAIVGLIFTAFSFIQAANEHTPLTQAEIVIGLVSLILAALTFILLEVVALAAVLATFLAAVFIVTFLLTFFGLRMFSSLTTLSGSGLHLDFESQDAVFIRRRRRAALLLLCGANGDALVRWRIAAPTIA